MLLWGQQDTSFAELPARDQFVLETEQNATADPTALLERRAAFREQPLDLNRATEADLYDLALLSDRQVGALLRYRDRLGGLLSHYELQAVPHFDLPTIRRLLRYARVGPATGTLARRWWQYWHSGRGELRLRWSRVLPTQAGYRSNGSVAPAYSGDPQQWRYHYRYRYGTNLSLGLTAEKDRGEPWRRKRGLPFDYHSGHLYLQHLAPWLPTLALGDYGLRLGQGLLINTTFSVGKGLTLASLPRVGRRLRPYTGLNESRFFRGAAAELQLLPGLEALVFWSGRRQSASLSAVDSTDGAVVTALREDGYHRTAAELAARHRLGHRTYGLSVRYARPAGHVALNALQHDFSLPLQPRWQPYNRFYFRGQRLPNASIDYRWRWKNLHAFGEWGYSANGALASVNGLLLGLGQRVDLAVVHRHYPRHFQTRWAAPVAEVSGARNEIGTYWGLEVRPAPRWRLRAYFDRWRHPWLRFDADAPSRGHEYRLRASYRRRHRLDTYLEIAFESKERNAADGYLSPRRRLQLRYQLSLLRRRALEWRSRLDGGWLRQDGQAPLRGVALYQDLLLRPLESPWHLTTRVAVFATDAYAIRFYSYENGLLYQFQIPAYYGRGVRAYLNLRFRSRRGLTLEGRYAYTFRADSATVGSGAEATPGPHRSEMALQLSWRL